MIMVGERVQMNIDGKAVRILPLILHLKDPELAGLDPWGFSRSQGTLALMRTNL